MLEDSEVTAAAVAPDEPGDLLDTDEALQTPPDDQQPDNSGGVMVALKVPNGDQYAVPDGTDPEDLHVTLTYLGKSNELSPEQKQAVLTSAHQAAQRFGRPPQALFPYDYGTFDADGPDGKPFVLHPYGQDLDELYGHVCNALKENGLGDKVAADYDFNPHVTLKYLQGDEQAPHSDYTPPNMDEVNFPHMRVSIGDDEHLIPLTPQDYRPVRPQQILASVEERLRNLVGDYNLSAARGTRASLPMLKAVYSREFQDSKPSSSQTLTASAFARCERFLKDLSSRRPTSPDVDLYPPPATTTKFDLALSSTDNLGSDLVKRHLMDSVIAESPTYRVFSLSRALAAAATSPNPSVQLELTESLRTLLADGNSSAARSLRAKLQLRDRYGRWIEMGRGIRFKVHLPGEPGSGTWYHGIVEGTDVPNGNVSVRLDDGRLVQVPANKLEQPAAILGLRGQRMNETPASQLDPNAPTIARLHEVPAPENAQEPVRPDAIRNVLEGLQQRVHDDIRDARPTEKDPIERMMRAVGEATRDLQNPDTAALESAITWIDHFMRDNPSMSRSNRETLQRAQDTFRDLVPVLQGYEHDDAQFQPQHHVQREQADRPRPFRKFRNGRAQDDAQVPAAAREIPPNGEEIHVAGLQRPDYVVPRRGNEPASALPEDVRDYLAGDYGVRMAFRPGADGRPDPNHVDLYGDKAHVQAALRDVWGLERAEDGSLHPVPDTSEPDDADSGPLASAQAAAHRMRDLGLTEAADRLDNVISERGDNPTPEGWRELSDELDGAGQFLDLIMPAVSPELQDQLRDLRDQLDEAAGNAWQQVYPNQPRPEARGQAPATPNVPSTDEHAVHRAIHDQLNAALDALGDMEDANVPIDDENVRDMINGVLESDQDGHYSRDELRSAFDDVMNEIHVGFQDRGIIPENDLNSAQEDAYNNFRRAINFAHGIAGGEIKVPGAEEDQGQADDSQDDPQSKDQFGADVPAGFDFDQVIMNNGTAVQLYNHTTSDGREWQVGVRPNRLGGAPMYVVRQGSTANGQRRWSIMNNQDNWDDVSSYFNRVEGNIDQQAQFEANRARAERERADEDARIQADHAARVAENVDDAGNPLPDGWTRHLDEANDAYYQDGNGNLVYQLADNLVLYGSTPDGRRVNLGQFDNWQSALERIQTHNREQQITQRENLINALDRSNINLSDDEKQAIRDARSIIEVRGVLSGNGDYAAMRRASADAQQADRMQPREREAYQRDRNVQALIRKIGNLPPRPTPQTPAENANNDELGRPLPTGWQRLTGEELSGEPMYQGPDGASAYVDRTRNGDPITLAYNNANGAPVQVTGLGDWDEVQQVLEDARQGRQSPNEQPLPDVPEQNADLHAEDDRTGFRNSLYENLLRIGVSPDTANRIFGMRSGNDVRDYVSNIPEVRELLSGVAGQDEDSVNPVDLRNARLLEGGIARVHDLAPPAPDLTPGDEPDANPEAQLESFLDRVGIPENERREILDDPSAAIDLIEGNERIRQMRTRATAGDEQSRRNVAELDALEAALQEATAPGDDLHTPGVPEGDPGNPNDVEDAGAPPQVPAAEPVRQGAPPGYENRYHPDGVIRDRYGRELKRGSRVISRRDGANVIGEVIAVQQQPPYARILWPDGRRQVRAAGRLEVVANDADAIPRDRAGAPINPAAPAAPANPAPEPAVQPQASALEAAQNIVGQHIAGADQGFPLLQRIADARGNLERAIGYINSGNRQNARDQVNQAITAYNDGMATADFSRARQDYRIDVQNRLAAARQLLENLDNEGFRLLPPNVQNIIAELGDLHDQLPRAVGRGITVAHRNIKYALGDALPLIRNGNLAAAEQPMRRAIWLAGQANKPEIQQQLQQAFDDLQALGVRRPVEPDRAAPIPAFGDAPEPRDFIANRFEGERAPQAASPSTPGVIDGRDARPDLPHPGAVNSSARQADYAQWGPRAAEIAQAARVRPGLNAIMTAPEQDVSQLLREAFGGIDGVSFGRSGYTLSIRGSRSSNHLSVSFTILDANGSHVGQGSRNFTNDGASWSAYNAGMSLERSAQSTGFANALNRYFENWYIANGFSQVTVSASGGGSSTGGFAWAMNGFGWGGVPVTGARNALAQLKRMTTAGTPEDAVVRQMEVRLAEARRTSNDDLLPTPMELALVGWAPGKTDWVGKQSMSNHSWSGKKTLTPTSVNWQQRQNYEIAKQAADRVANRDNQFNVNRTFANSIADMSAPGLREAGITPVEAENVAGLMKSTNPTAASLPFTTKRKFFRWANTQAAAGNWNSDIESVVQTLQRELLADYPGEDNLGVGAELRRFNVDQLMANNVPGWSVQTLGQGDSGINVTFRVTHDGSGQVYYVKHDTGFMDPRIQQALSYPNPARTTGAEAEADMNAFLRAANWPGIDVAQSHHLEDTEDGLDSNVDNAVVQHFVGDNMDLVRRPQAPGQMGEGIAANNLDNLAVHDQLLRMLLLDGISGNVDRHRMNFLMGQDTGSKWWLFPIDHGLVQAPVDGYDRTDPFALISKTLNEDHRTEFYADVLRDYANRHTADGLSSIIQGILNDYRAAANGDPGQYRSGDFAGKMTENIELIEARMEELIRLLQSRG